MSDIENTRDELVETMRELAEQFKGLGMHSDTVRALASRNLTAAQRDELARREYERRIKESNAKMHSNIKAATDGLLSFSKSLSSAPGSFAPLKEVVGLTSKAFGGLVGSIPLLGGALKAVSEAAGDAAKMMIDSFQSAYSTFEKLSDVGVVGQFEDLKRNSENLGLTFADTEKVLGKASVNMSMIGGSAAKGSKFMALLGAETEDTRRVFQRLGINAADFSEFQASYVAQQTRLNRGELKSLTELSAGSERYITNLDALAKLTGVSRKQQQTDLEERMRDARYRAGIASLDGDARQNIDNLLSVIKSMGPEMAGMEEGLKDMIASGGVLSTEASKAVSTAMSRAGVNMVDMVQKLRSNAMTGFEAVNTLANAAGKAADQSEKLASIKGDELMVTKLQVALRELETRKGKLTQAEYEKQVAAIKKTTTTSEGQNAALAGAKTAMYNAGRNIELLATSSEVATKAMKWFAEGIEYVTEKVYEITGAQKPEHIKARQEERVALEALKKSRERNAVAEAQGMVSQQEAAAMGAGGAPWSEQSKQEAFNLAFERVKKEIDEEVGKKSKERELATMKRRSAEIAVGIKPKDDELLRMMKSPEVEAAESKVAQLSEKLTKADAALTIAEDDKKKIADAVNAQKDHIAKLKAENKTDELKGEQAQLKALEDELAKKKTLAEKLKAEKEKVQSDVNKAEDIRNRARLEDIVGKKEKLDETVSVIEELSKKDKATYEKFDKLVQEQEKQILKQIESDTTLSKQAREMAVQQAKPRARDVALRSMQGEIEKSTGKKITLPPYPGAPKDTSGRKSGAVSEAQGLKNPYEAVRFTGKTGSREHFEKLQEQNPEMAKQFLLMAADYMAATKGKKLQVNSSFRSYQEQENVDSGGNPKAKPGESLHNYGRAIDINSDQKSFLIEKGLLEKYGFKHLGDKDPPHIFMADGGVINARPGGTRVTAGEAGMNEAFVPLPNGKSIPVEMKSDAFRELHVNFSEATDQLSKIMSDTNQSLQRSNDRLVEKIDALVGLFSETNAHLNEVAALLYSSKQIQKNILNSSPI